MLDAATSTTKQIKRIGVLPGRFVGRETFYQPRPELQKAIAASLKESHVVALVGPLGAGKTTEALAFVYDQTDPEKYDLIIWLDCSSFDKFTAECQAVETQLGLATWSLYVYLEAYEGKWLLVLDNAKTGTPPNLPNTTRGHVLITSYESLWPNVIRVSNMRREESQALLRKFLNRSADTSKSTKHVIEIVDALNDHPQAITDAAKDIIDNAIPLEDYHQRILRQSAQAYPVEECPANFCERVFKIVADFVVVPVSIEKAICFRLLCAMSHLNSAFIPRDLLNELVREDLDFPNLPNVRPIMNIINNVGGNKTATQIQQALIQLKDQLQHETSQLLLLLKQKGLVEIISHPGEPSFLMIPVLAALRYYFSTDKFCVNNPIEYRQQLNKVLTQLSFFLDKKYDPQDGQPRFFYMHSKGLLDRIMGVIQTDGEEYYKRVDKDTERVIRNLTRTLPYEETSIGHIALSHDEMIHVLRFIQRFVAQLERYNELDAAFFYGNIAQLVLEKQYPFLLRAVREKPVDFDINVPEWDTQRNIFLLYKDILNINAIIRSRRNLEPNIDNFNKACTLFQKSYHIAYRELEAIRPPLIWPVDLLVQFFHLQRRWINIRIKAIPFDYYDPAGEITRAFQWQPGNERTLTFFEFRVGYDIAILDLVNQELVLPHVNAIAAIPLVGDKKELILSYYGGILAFIAKQQEKHKRYPFHRYKKLKRLNDISTLKKLLTRDLLDSREEYYELNKILDLILDARSNKKNALPYGVDQKCQYIRTKLVELRKRLRWEHGKTATQLLHSPEIQDELNSLVTILKLTIIAVKERFPVPLGIPYQQAIDLFQKGFDYYQQIQTPQSNFALIFYYYKFGRYFLDRYRAYRENGNSRSQDKKDALKKAWFYYDKAKNAYFEYFHHDEPVLVAVHIFLGLLTLVAKFKEEAKDELPPEWKNPDKQKDYFNRCRFILSRLYYESYHYVRKLFNIALRLELSNKLTSPNQLFDVVLIPANIYYESKLQEVHDRLQSQPSDIWFRFTRARIMLQLGMYTAAVVEFNAFLDIYPYSSNALALRGFAQYRLGNFEAALVDFADSQQCHGNHDLLLEKWKMYCEQALIIKTLDIRNIIPPASKISIFIDKVRSRFAARLKSSIEKAMGEDNRLSVSEAGSRVVKAVSTLIPRSLAFMGVTTDIPIAETIKGLADVYAERKRQAEVYKNNKVARTNIIPEELKQSEVFESVLQQLVRIFSNYFSHLTYKGAIDLARYLADSMIDYLGSDRLVPYLPLEQKLLRGAMEGEKYSFRFLQVEGPTCLPYPFNHQWRPTGVVRYSSIRTPNGNLFVRDAKFNCFHSRYLERAGTEEEARALGFKEKPDASISSLAPS